MNPGIGRGAFLGLEVWIERNAEARRQRREALRQRREARRQRREALRQRREALGFSVGGWHRVASP